MNFDINTSIAYPLSQNPKQRFTYQRKEYPQMVNLEEKLAKIYSANRVVLVNSGMEAITTLLDLVLDNDDTIIINRNLYAEAQLWIKAINRYKVEMFDFVNGNLGEFDELCKRVKPKLIHFDNPNMRQQFIDAETIIKIAHKNNAKVNVDNSIVSFINYNPILFGADFVTESYSKYICGHNDTMAGALIFKDQPPTKNGVQLIDFLEWRGRCVNPIQVYNVERGLETLKLRLDNITKAAHIVCEELTKNNIKHFYCGQAGCIIIPQPHPLKVQKALTDTGKFIALSAYGATFNICTPSRREDSYQDFMSYIRLSIGVQENEEAVKNLSKLIIQTLEK